jgi:hypothetical protein
MTDETSTPQTDPLTVGKLISLQEVLPLLMVDNSVQRFLTI